MVDEGAASDKAHHLSGLMQERQKEAWLMAAADGFLGAAPE